jgi:hypothetical protein
MTDVYTFYIYNKMSMRIHIFMTMNEKSIKNIIIDRLFKQYKIIK